MYIEVFAMYNPLYGIGYDTAHSCLFSEWGSTEYAYIAVMSE